MRRRAASSFGVLVLGLALALAPAMTFQAGATSKHKVDKHHKKKTSEVKDSAGACTAFNSEETQSSGLGTALEQAFASGNFASIKAAMLTEFTNLDTDVSKAKSYLSSAPANVQAAFDTIANAFGQLKTALENATSLTQLESSFTALGSNTGLTAAGQVLATYFGDKYKCTVPKVTVPTVAPPTS
jgi:hypothetical protein